MTLGEQPSGSPSEAKAGDPEADPEARARQICLRLLTAAPRTRAQLAAALRRGKVPDEVAEAVLSRFADVGLIDDAAFARAWVESRHHSRGLSRRSLSAELRRTGVASEDIREAVDTLDPEQEVATARRLVEQKMAATRGQPPAARARRAAGLLARKGYPPGLVFRLIRESLEREGQALELDSDQYLDPDVDETSGLGSLGGPPEQCRQQEGHPEGRRILRLFRHRSSMSRTSSIVRIVRCIKQTSTAGAPEA